MTPQAAGLNTIARAEATPAQAREILEAVFGRPSPDLLRDAYLALRAWTWRALHQRRRDAELREWHDIIASSSALMERHGQPALAERLTALGELLAESFAVGETLAATEVARRQHVAEALDFLARRSGQASRSAIGEHLSLGQANLTRVLNLMSAAGLVERSTHGREAVFRLSRRGSPPSSAAGIGPGQGEIGEGRYDVEVPGDGWGLAALRWGHLFLSSAGIVRVG